MHSTSLQSSLLSPHAGCHHLSELLSNQKRLPFAEVAGYAEPVRLSAADGPERSEGAQGNSAKIAARVGAGHEQDRPGGICLSSNRREDQRAWDWRGKTLAKVREIIHAADPEIVEGRERLSGTVSFGRGTLDAKGGQNFCGHLRAPWNTRRI